MPQYAPRMIDSGHNFLTININADSHTGDGPIVSTKLLYKPAKDYQPWMSVEGKGQFFHPITHTETSSTVKLKKNRNVVFALT